MSEWSKTTLGDVCELKRGYDLPASQREHGAIPIVSSSGITGFHSVAKVTGPGVVTGRYGTLGEVFYIEDDFWPLNTALYVRDFKGNEPRFVAALLQSLELGRNQVAAAVPGVNRNQLHTLPVRVPTVSTQRAISSVLSSLDEAVDNTRRRIEVLEQIVQAVYVEWFVRLRFPGHENVSLVDSRIGPIPQGWELLTIGDVLELKYGKALKAAERHGGPVAVVGSSEVLGWHDTALLDGPAIVVGRKGNVGSVVWVDEPAWPIDTTYYVATSLPLRYVREQLSRAEFMNTHAAVPGLNREQAYTLPFLRPPDSLMALYSEIAETLGSASLNIRKQSKRLSEMRDLLLPKLVTGQLDVSELYLDAAVGSVA